MFLLITQASLFKRKLLDAGVEVSNLPAPFFAESSALLESTKGARFCKVRPKGVYMVSQVVTRFLKRATRGLGSGLR